MQMLSCHDANKPQIECDRERQDSPEKIVTSRIDGDEYRRCNGEVEKSSRFTPDCPTENKADESDSDEKSCLLPSLQLVEISPIKKLRDDMCMDYHAQHLL